MKHNDAANGFPAPEGLASQSESAFSFPAPEAPALKTGLAAGFSSPEGVALDSGTASRFPTPQGRALDSRLATRFPSPRWEGTGEGESRLQLISIPHPFRPSERDIRAVNHVSGATILDIYLEHFPGCPDLRCFLNGLRVARENWGNTYLNPGDCLAFGMELRGGEDGKGIFRALLMIAVVVASFLMPGPWTQMGFLLIGGLLVNALLPPPKPSVPTTSADDQAATYSWQPRNTEQQGIVVPKWYGEHRVFGNIIVSFIENENSDQYLNLLISLGLGPVQNISEFELNDQPQSSYKDFQTWVRRGLLNQESIANFAGTKVEYPHPNTLVTHENPVTFETEGNDFDALEVDVEFPLGLYLANDQGGFADYSVDLSVEIQPITGGSWVPLARKDTGAGLLLTTLPQARWSLGYKYGTTASSSYGTNPYGSIGGLGDLTGERGGFLDPTNPAWVGKWVDVYFDTPPVFTAPSGYPPAPTSYPDPFNPASHDPHFPEEVVGYDVFSGWKDDQYVDYCEPIKYTWRWIDTKEEIVQRSEHIIVNQFTATAHQTSPVRYTFKKDIALDAPKGQYRVRITRITADNTATSIGDKLYFGSIREVYRDPFQYPGQALVGYRVKATDQISGNLSFSALLAGAVVRIYGGSRGSGAHNLKTTGTSSTVTTTGNAFAALQPGSEIRANGEFRTVTAKAGPNQVTVSPPINWENGGGGYPFTYENWSFAWSDNPAWVALDVLTQPVLGGSGSDTDPYVALRYDGVDPQRIDLPKFKEWADYCDELVDLVDTDGLPTGESEKRITFNGGFDSATSLWEAVLKVCQVGRAVPVWNGLNLTLAIDKPADPVFLFSVGNIEESRFKETFLTDEGRANEIEIDYTNRDNNYERDKLTVSRSDVETGNGFKADLELFGITKQSEAWRAGMYRLMCNKYLIRTVELDVDIEALNATVGDVGFIQHDVPRWGEGGRIVSGTLNSVTLDKEVTLADGASYKILLRLSDDTLCERAVSNLAGTYTTINVSQAFPAAPQPFDVYALGQVNCPAKLFRIIEISKTHDQKCTVKCIEYRPEIFQFEDAAPPLQSRSQILLKGMLPRSVAMKQWRILPEGANGSVVLAINISFTPCQHAEYSHLEVWFKLPDDSRYNWRYSGKTTGNTYQIAGVAANTTYRIILIPVDVFGEKLHIDYAPAYTFQTIKSSRAYDINFKDGTLLENLQPAEKGSTRNIVTNAPSITPPSNPGTGDLWYQTDTLLLMKWSGTAWAAVATNYTDVAQMEDAYDLLLGDVLAKSVTLGTGGRFRSAESGARIEISKNEVAGYGADGTTREFHIDAVTGKAFAGGGDVVFDANGISLKNGMQGGDLGGSTSPPNVIAWKESSGILTAQIATFNLVSSTLKKIMQSVVCSTGSAEYVSNSVGAVSNAAHSATVSLYASYNAGATHLTAGLDVTSDPAGIGTEDARVVRSIGDKFVCALPAGTDVFKVISDGVHILSGSLHTSAIRPLADGVAALQVQKVDGTVLATFDTTNARMGIGISPGYKLDVYESITNVTLGCALRVQQDYACTGNRASDNIFGMIVKKAGFNVPDGYTVGGYQVGLASHCYIDNNNFAGTITDMRAVWARVGMYQAAAAGTRTVTNAYGMYVENLATVGTIVNNWGIYQTLYTAKNYFAGPIINGPTAISGNTVGAGGTLGMSTSILPTATTADYAWLAEKDAGGSAGKGALHLRSENMGSADWAIVSGFVYKNSTGDYGNPHEGLGCINTADKSVKLYAGGAWRTLVTWT